MTIFDYVINKIDLIIYIVIFLFCVLGAIKGAVRQFFSILAFVIASIFCIVIPNFVALPLGDIISPLWAYLILAILIWIPAYLILNSMGKYFANKLVKSSISFTDRIWGLFFGATKGLLFSLLLVFFTGAFVEPIGQVFPFFPTVFEESKFCSFAQQYNPLLRLRLINNLRILARSLNDPDYAQLLAENPEFKGLIEQDSIRAIMDDDELMDLLQKRSYFKFATDPKIQQLVNDPEAIQLLTTVNLDKEVQDTI